MNDIYHPCWGQPVFTSKLDNPSKWPNLLRVSETTRLQVEKVGLWKLLCFTVSSNSNLKWGNHHFHPFSNRTGLHGGFFLCSTVKQPCRFSGRYSLYSLFFDDHLHETSNVQRSRRSPRWTPSASFVPRRRAGPYSQKAWHGWRWKWFKMHPSPRHQV